MSEEKLPRGWKVVKFKDVTTIIGGGTPSTSIEEYYNGDIPWLSPVDLSGYKEKYISRGRKNITQLGLQKSSARLLPKNSVLFSSRAPIGYVAIAENEITTNQGFKNLLPSPLYDPSFAYFYLKYKRDYIESQASGTTFKEISGKKLGEIEFILPPLPEQQRIVAKLDEIFGHLDRVREKLDRIPELLKNFRQQVLSQAVTGKLTEEWRKGKDAKWNETTLGSIVKVSSGKGLTAKDRVEEGEYLVYGGNGVTGNHKEFLFEDPQLIIGRVGAHCGNVHITVNNSWVTDNALVARFDSNKYDIIYLTFLIRNLDLNKYSESTAQPVISGSKIYPIAVAVPYIEEQKQIIRVAEELFKLSDHIETQYASLKARIDSLPRAILNKTFKGELVLQDQSEETDSELLKQTQNKKK